MMKERSHETLNRKAGIAAAEMQGPSMRLSCLVEEYTVVMENGAGRCIAQAAHSSKRWSLSNR